MTKSLYRGLYPYCDKDTCKYWNKCTLAFTDELKKTVCDPEIKTFHACYAKLEVEG